MKQDNTFLLTRAAHLSVTAGTEDRLCAIHADLEAKAAKAKAGTSTGGTTDPHTVEGAADGAEPMVVSNAPADPCAHEHGMVSGNCQYAAAYFAPIPNHTTQTQPSA